MFLKSIELFGFKSFAERTKIEFSSGIAALLGPNGCGKSNIVDAIKWVLGEQATRSLRADKMEDIIFNGTESRKALNVAEVSLIISNNNELLPIGTPELSIKRRLFRSGESQYFINESPVKLKELKELFFDTGIGKSTYSIMEQGRIDQILSVKPEDRRFIFEEASGITKYRIRGEEAEKKLTATEENMRNLQAVIGEVRKSYENLKKQAEKTGRYRELQEKLFLLETKYDLLKLRDLNEKNEILREREERVQKKQDVLKAKIDRINASMENSIEDVNKMESRLVDIQKMLYKVDLEKSSSNNQIKVLRDRIEEQNLKKSNLISRNKFIEEKIKRIKTQCDDITLRCTKLNKSKSEIDLNIENFTAGINNYELKIEENENSINKYEDENHELELLLEEMREDLRSITDAIVSQLDKKLNETEYSSEKKLKLEQNIETYIKQIKVQLQKKKDYLKETLYSVNSNSIESILKLMVESYDKLDALLLLFKEYKKYNLSFLDDFLSTNGIITRKRTVDNKVKDAVNKLTENRSKITGMKKDNSLSMQKLKEYRNTLGDLKINRARVVSEEKAYRKEFMRLEEEASEYAAMFDENKSEINDIEHKIKSFIKQIELLTDKQENYKKKEEEYRKELNDVKTKIKKSSEKLTFNEKDLKRNMGDLNRIQLQIEKVKLDYARLQTEIKNVYENYMEKHSRDLSESEHEMFSVRESFQTLKAEIGRIKKDISVLGQVNLMALEEYSEVKERYDFLSTQIEDLSKAKEDLDRITDEIKKESTELFMNTYESIKRNFHLMFRRLFGGGRAELALSNPEKPLESGIEILAQPPGKKLESMALLSGGERSLAAIALMFATYMVKPSPFCILDEIDAAMDEGNVGQFISLLQEFSNQTQFIVITHNKRTVAGAGILYGITMEESGISKMITIKVKNRGNSLTYAK
ncbi:MAG: AAA family ATPase [Spirochaetes bacterium]|nr:AAA family ATPase [Spirochaetota bacterium]